MKVIGGDVVAFVEELLNISLFVSKYSISFEHLSQGREERNEEGLGRGLLGL